MNIADNYVKILVYFCKISCEGVHLSYSCHEMLDNMYEFMIYIHCIYNELVRSNNVHNYDGIFFTTRLLSYNDLFLQFYPISNVIFYA